MTDISHITRKDLLKAYDEGGSFDRASYLLGINRKTYSKLWAKLIGAVPPRPTDKTRRPKRLTDDSKYRIAIMSDPHIGSKFFADEELSDFIKQCKRFGVDTLVCAGDVTDGYHMHPGMEFEQDARGVDDFLQMVKEYYPKGFKENYFITGNHDDSFRKNCALNIGPQIELVRPDLTYLGRDAADLELETGLKLHLYHGGGACGASRSQRLQKYAVNLAQMPSQMPHIVIGGHCHMLSVTPNYMKAVLISCPGFQHMTPYLQGKGLTPDIGGIILSYEMKNGKLVNPGTEFILYETLIPKRKY